MKKIIAIILVTLLTLSVFTACGTSETSDNTKNSSDTSSSAEEYTVDVLAIESSVELCDYSHIEISKSDIEPEKTMIDAFVSSFVNLNSTTENITEGIVETGDTLSVNYVGTIDGEEFDGGSAEEASVTIGSNTYIEGFESGLIGHNIGETVELDLVFPESYYVEDLAGKPVKFVVTILSKNITTTPELNDEYVVNNSVAYTGEQINTVEEFYSYLHDYIYYRNIQNEINSYLKDNSNIVIAEADESYRETLQYYIDIVNTYAEKYEISPEEYIKNFGYDDVYSYAEESAQESYSEILLYDTLFDELGLTLTDEELDSRIESYMEEYGYSKNYTLEEFKEESGAMWVKLYSSTSVKMDKIIEQLQENNVTIVE